MTKRVIVENTINELNHIVTQSQWPNNICSH